MVSFAFTRTISLPIPRLFILFLMSSSIARGQTLSLGDALRFALQNAPSLEQARQLEGISELERRNAQSRFFPSLDASASHGVSKTSPPSPTEPWTSQLGVSLTEHLYDNGVSLLQYDVAGINREYARLFAQK